MAIPGSTQRPENQPVITPTPQKETKKLLQQPTLYKEDTKPLSGEMPKMSQKMSQVKPPPVFSYKTAKSDPEARKQVAQLLQPGDVIVMRVEKSAGRDIIDKINHWFQKTFSSLYQTDSIKIQKEDTQATHIILVTHVNKERGEIVVSEAVTAGARTIDYFEHKNFALKSGAVHEVFRPNLGGSSADINRVACKAMKMTTAGKGSLTSEESKVDTSKKPAPYSKLKAFRSLFTSGFGRNANQQRITRKMLDQYNRFEAGKTAENPKKRSVFCSQLVSSNLQFGVFHVAVSNLKKNDESFAQALEKFNDPNRRITRSQYREFTDKFGPLIFAEMKELCPQIKFSASNMSPTGFSALLRNAGLGTPVCNIKD